MLMVTYDYYKNSYGGHLIPEPSWKPIAVRAETRLDGYTFGRLPGSWPNKAKIAVCEMAECLYKHDKRDGKISENNDGYSVSYDTSQPLDSLLYGIAKVYLGDTEYMYLGVEEC